MCSYVDMFCVVDYLMICFGLLSLSFYLSLCVCVYE